METSNEILAFLGILHKQRNHTSFDVYLQRIPLMSRNSSVYSTFFFFFLDVTFLCVKILAIQTVFLFE